MAKMTAEKEIQFCTVLMVGGSFRTAAELVDVPESTLRNRIHRNPVFRKQVMTARRHAEFMALRNVQNAGEKYWRASAWSLERLRPEVYGVRKPRQLTFDEMAEELEETVNGLAQYLTSEEDRQAVIEALERQTQRIRDDENPFGKAIRKRTPKSRSARRGRS